VITGSVVNFCDARCASAMLCFVQSCCGRPVATFLLCPAYSSRLALLCEEQVYESRGLSKHTLHFAPSTFLLPPLFCSLHFLLPPRVAPRSSQQLTERICHLPSPLLTPPAHSLRTVHNIISAIAYRFWHFNIHTSLTRAHFRGLPGLRGLNASSSTSDLLELREDQVTRKYSRDGGSGRVWGETRDSFWHRKPGPTNTASYNRAWATNSPALTLTRIVFQCKRDYHALLACSTTTGLPHIESSKRGLRVSTRTTQHPTPTNRVSVLTTSAA